MTPAAIMPACRSGQKAPDCKVLVAHNAHCDYIGSLVVCLGPLRPIGSYQFSFFRQSGLEDLKC